MSPHTRARLALAEVRENRGMRECALELRTASETPPNFEILQDVPPSTASAAYPLI